MVPLTLTQIALAAGAVTVGATLQGSIGFGLGLVAAPLLVLIDPRFIPAPLLLASVVLTVLLTHREWRSVQFRDLGWAIGGRMVGIAAAIAALLLISPNRIALFFGVLILLMVGLTASGLHLPPTPRTLLGAGMLSGFSGTAVSIGGPPMASLVGLRIAGRLGRTELLLSLALLPGILLGYLISRHTARLLDRGYTRSAVLAVSGAAGVVVIIKQLI